MSDIDADLIDHIRAASRLMVRELGFMQATVAATDYPPASQPLASAANPGTSSQPYQPRR